MRNATITFILGVLLALVSAEVFLVFPHWEPLVSCLVGSILVFSSIFLVPIKRK